MMMGVVGARGRAGAVDHARVGQRDDGRVDLDEGANTVAELWLCREQRRDGRREAERHG